MIEDGRSKRDRIARADFHCTVCSSKLLDDLSTWGIVWDSRRHGLCMDCLTRLRKNVDPKRIAAFESRTESMGSDSRDVECQDDFIFQD